MNNQRIAIDFVYTTHSGKEVRRKDEVRKEEEKNFICGYGEQVDQ